MADSMRWRYGETHSKMFAVDTAQTVDQGDCCWLNTDDARPADQVAFTGGINTAQELFVDNFAGVAMDRSLSGETAEIRLAQAGVFEFTCTAAQFEVGDLVGMDDNATPDALESQKVIAVTDAARAIGRVAKRATSNVTTVLVEINATLRTGGPQKGEASA